MIDLRERLMRSSVLRPEFIVRGVTESKVPDFLSTIRQTETELLKLSGDLWVLGSDFDPQSDFQIILDRVSVSGDEDGLALLGELFVERPEQIEGLPQPAIEKYFEALDGGPFIYREYSQGLLCLRRFLMSKTSDHLKQSIFRFRRAALEGHFPSVNLYLTLRKTYLATKRVQGNRIQRSFFRKPYIFLGNLLVSVFSVIVSTDLSPKQRWWRYQDVEEFLPRNIARVERKLSSREFSW